MNIDSAIFGKDNTGNRASLRDYISMTKPTITLLVVVTAVPSLLLDVSSIPSWGLIIATLIGAGLTSGSAAVFNQIVEYRSDKKMKRTSSRGVASGKINRLQAAMFGSTIGILGLCALYTFATPLASLIALIGHVYYVFIYTMLLKRRTPQNIVIGGAAGAVGPLIGSAAATGGITISAWLLFLLIFLWTPPHFWALALKYKNDYATAGIPMYPVVFGDHKTRWAMFMYTLSLIPIAVMLSYTTGVGYASTLVIWLTTIKFGWDAWKLYISGSNKRAMPLFHFSCIYTFAIFVTIAIERVITIT